MKVLFLDIDGVLKKLLCGNECDYTADELAEMHKEGFLRCGFDYEKETDISDEFKSHTIKGAIRRSRGYIRPKIVKMIKEALDDTGAKIVVSSNWREGGYPLVKALLSMHGLDRYVIGMTSFGMPVFRPREIEKTDWRMHRAGDEALEKVCKLLADRYARPKEYLWIRQRIPEIMDYLHRHREIDSYAVVDDEDYVDLVFGKHGVHTDYTFKSEDLPKLYEALGIEDGPYCFDLIDQVPEISAWHEKWDDYYARRLTVPVEAI